MPDYIKMYSSVAEIRALDKTLDLPPKYEVIHARPAYTFHGVQSLSELEGYLDRGWPEGEKYARSTLKALSIPRTKTVRRRKTRGDFGDHLDIQRVYAGSLDTAWERTERTYAEGRLGRHVTLLVNIGALASRHKSDLFWRGAVTMVLADELEKAGRRCEVVAYSWARGAYRDGSFALTGIKVKDFDQPLEPQKLITVTGHAGFVRWYVFRNRYLNQTAVLQGHLGETVDRVPSYALLSIPASRNVIPINNVYSRGDAEILLQQVLTKEMKS